jgi:hypothetical protein
MTHSISQRVHQRILQGFQHAAIGVHAGASGKELDIFRLIACQVPHHFAITFQEALGRHHARLPNVTLELLSEVAYGPGAALVQTAHGRRLS